MPNVIVIPADLTQPCEVKELSDDSYREIGELVGGAPEQARYDRDAVVYVQGNGAAEGLDPNERATRYALTQSEAGQRHGYAVGTPLHALPYLLYGDAVLIGSDEQNVPERFLQPDRLGWVLERKDGGALAGGAGGRDDLAGAPSGGPTPPAKREAKTQDHPGAPAAAGPAHRAWRGAPPRWPRRGHHGRFEIGGP